MTQEAEKALEDDVEQVRQAMHDGVRDEQGEAALVRILAALRSLRTELRAHQLAGAEMDRQHNEDHRYIEALEKAWDKATDHALRRHQCDWGHTERPTREST